MSFYVFMPLSGQYHLLHPPVNAATIWTFITIE